MEVAKLQSCTRNLTKKEHTIKRVILHLVQWNHASGMALRVTPVVSSSDMLCLTLGPRETPSALGASRLMALESVAACTDLLRAERVARCLDLNKPPRRLLLALTRALVWVVRLRQRGERPPRLLARGGSADPQHHVRRAGREAARRPPLLFVRRGVPLGGALLLRGVGLRAASALCAPVVEPQLGDGDVEEVAVSAADGDVRGHVEEPRSLHCWDFEALAAALGGDGGEVLQHLLPRLVAHGAPRAHAVPIRQRLAEGAPGGTPPPEFLVDVGALDGVSAHAAARACHHP
mmetsp:Transcript_4925/g.12101  ORF Transcript_4925/g.12101 Transcript_4925/m.12101 type:complete len:291 (+) Transcript_4925:141-1013(+)